jgi:hypothetical protein
MTASLVGRSAERTGAWSDSRIQELIELIMVASSGEGKIAKGTTHQQARH